MKFKSEVLAQAADQAITSHLNSNDDDGSQNNLYRQIVDEVERPVLEAIMKHHRGNQSKCAERLGLNRATFRKKLKRHGML